MRTKLILTTAALGVASLGAFAQVYSVNAVGYINVAVPANGYALVVNQLNAGENKVGQVLPNVPEDTIVFTYSQAGGFTANQFSFGEWTDANATLAPGKGFFLQNLTAAAITVTLVGEVPQGTALTTALSAGLNLVGSQVPQAGGLSTALGFPAAENDTVFQWNPATQSYNAANQFAFGAWDPAEPQIGVAEGFFVDKAAAASWTRSFSVNQ